MAQLEGFRVGGITPFTTIDFPNHLSAVFYTQGCPWRCRYCFNSKFQPMRREDSEITSEKLINFLKSRSGLLDGIVFSGGEPTLHTHLGEWMASVKRMGYKVGLHTSGMSPEGLRSVVNLCDWVGMDVKAPFHRYAEITQIEGSGEGPLESLSIILRSGVDHEFRTTVHPTLTTEDNILEIACEIADLGAQRYALQACQPEKCADESLRESRIAKLLISEQLRGFLSRLFKKFVIRG